MYISRRTPLNIVSIGLELLKKRNKNGTLTSEELDELLDYCVVATDAGVNILTDLLSYEKISSNAFTLELVETRLLSLILAKLNPFLLHASQKDIQLNILRNLDSADPLASVYVLVDPNKIAQVLRNLVSNALKFTPAGGVIDISVALIESDK
jgi:signal transduction histidine kinase